MIFQTACLFVGYAVFCCEKTFVSLPAFDKISDRKVVYFHGEVGMEIEIYLDSLFFLNFMINLWILQLLNMKFILNTQAFRMWISAGIGAGIYLLSFWFSGNTLFIPLCVMLASLPVMAGIVVPKRKRRYLVRVIGWGLLYGFMISGILRAVLYKWRLLKGKEITATAVLAGAYLCMRVGIWGIEKGKTVGKKCICTAVICSAGVETPIKALLDTGNSLIEPISRKPVCIVEEEILARITLENTLFLRAIPYRSIGCEQGTLYGVEIPKIKIFTENACYTAEHVICAGAPHKLSTKGVYRMILHPALLTEEFLEDNKEEQNVIGERDEKNDIHACGQGLV